MFDTLKLPPLVKSLPLSLPFWGVKSQHFISFQTLEEQGNVSLERVCLLVCLFVCLFVCSVLFCSVLFCSVLFCSVLFCSVLFCSVLFFFRILCFA